MKEERREGLRPVPSNFMDLMTDLQTAALNQLEIFGWSLAFVRRVGIPSPIFVVEGPLPRQYGILQGDGVLEQNIPFALR